MGTLLQKWFSNVGHNMLDPSNNEEDTPLGLLVPNNGKVVVDGV